MFSLAFYKDMAVIKLTPQVVVHFYWQKKRNTDRQTDRLEDLQLVYLASGQG